jgi:hypothetical protein
MTGLAGEQQAGHAERVSTFSLLWSSLLYTDYGEEENDGQR